MSQKHSEIADDEIRIISAYEPKAGKKKSRFLRVYLPIAAVVILLLLLVWVLVPADDDADEVELLPQIQEELAIEQPAAEPHEPVVTARGSVTAIDTVIGRKGLLIIYPENLRPRLVVGSDHLNDSSIVLATQAADIRKDNGQIAGTFVMEGELISKGETKAGYCSIINGELSIGIADATPMLEQTLTEGGYFFRQYPLVVGGQIVENKPKGKAIRKALADIGGKICVVMSKERVTFHDFSQMLIDLGVRNAIYLVGSASYGFYITENGNKILTGIAPQQEVENVSYIIWE